MSMNLIQEDVTMMRDRYDEALEMLGIPAKYQYPKMVDSNAYGEPVIDSYSIPQDVRIFFDSAPKLKTFKRLGWVVENDQNLPFLIHCSFHLENLQKDCIFEIGGMYAEVTSRKFRVTELTTDLQAPDHVTCQVVPAYEEQLVGKTKKEIEMKYKGSSNFLKPNTDYRGTERTARPGDK